MHIRYDVITYKYYIRPPPVGHRPLGAPSGADGPELVEFSLRATPFIRTPLIIKRGMRPQLVSDLMGRLTHEWAPLKAKTRRNNGPVSGVLNRKCSSTPPPPLKVCLLKSELR